MADIENWLTSGMSQFIQMQKIPKRLNGRKLKQSLNMAQEISWSVSLRTAGIFGSFV